MQIGQGRGDHIKSIKFWKASDTDIKKAPEATAFSAWWSFSESILHSLLINWQKHLYICICKWGKGTQGGNDIKPLIPVLLSQATCETLCLSAALI